MRFSPVRATSALFLAALLIPTLAAAQQHWKQVGSMSTPRVFASVTTLQDGRVLIVGGTDDGTNVFSSAEINTPDDATTVPTAPMGVARYGHSAIRLNDGRVLVVGGLDANIDETAESEIYNPVSGNWSPTGLTPYVSTLPQLALLPDGRVFATGMSDIIDCCQPNKSAIYDPASNTWTTAAPSSDAYYRNLPTSTVLGDGRFLLAGGGGQTASEIYDPATDSWTPAADMNEVDFGLARLLTLPDGRIAYVGSYNHIEFYDVATNTWTLASPMSTSTIVYGVPMLLADGRILIAGGIDITVQPFTSLNVTQIFDPATSAWAFDTPMAGVHAVATAAPLGDGRYVIAGAYIGGGTQIDMVGDNDPPVANAGSDKSASTCDSCGPAAVVVDASGSSDPENDALTFIWSEGAATLATTTQPTATLLLGAGTHTITLTVRDSLGAEDTDEVVVTVSNVEDGWRLIVDDLNGQISALQTALAACQAGGGAQNPAPTMDTFEASLQALFNDPAFELPGTTGLAELQNLITAIKAMPAGQVKQLYKSLGGKK